jgi:hypothetical protein
VNVILLPASLLAAEQSARPAGLHVNPAVHNAGITEANLGEKITDEEQPKARGTRGGVGGH